MFRILNGVMIGLPGFCLFGVALLFGWRGLRYKPKALIPSIGWCMAALFAMFTLHFALGASSYNNDSRYYFLDVSALFFSAFVLLLSGDRLIWLRRLAVILIAGFSIFVRVTECLPIEQRSSLMMTAETWTSFGDGGKDCPYVKPDPGNILFDQVLPLIQKPGIPKVVLYPTLYRWPITWFFEPFAMRLVSLGSED